MADETTLKLYGPSPELRHHGKEALSRSGVKYGNALLEPYQ